jgi:undecaprenyl-diphosphatase
MILTKIQTIDELILEKISRMHSPFRNRVMKIITSLGNVGWVWFLLCLILLSLPKYRNAGVNIIFGLLINQVMGEGIIKHIVKRTRPCHLLDDDEQIINRPKHYSFPSGHAAASFAVSAVVLCTCKWYVFLPVLLLAMLIAFSRMYLRVHYLTDVLCGAVLGFLCGLSSVALYQNFLQSTFNF